MVAANALAWRAPVESTCVLTRAGSLRCEWLHVCAAPTPFVACLHALGGAALTLLFLLGFLCCQMFLTEDFTACLYMRAAYGLPCTESALALLSRMYVCVCVCVSCVHQAMSVLCAAPQFVGMLGWPPRQWPVAGRLGDVCGLLSEPWGSLYAQGVSCASCSCRGPAHLVVC